MKKILTLLILAAIIYGGYLTWQKFFNRLDLKYTEALGQMEEGQYELALPILIKAYKDNDKNNSFPDAELMLARCETAIDSQNVGRWNLIISNTTSQVVAAEGRYNLVKVNPTPEAKKAYVNDFPDAEQSQNFLYELGEEALAQNNPLEALKYFQKIIKNYPDSPSTVEILDKVGQLNIELLFSQRTLPYAVQHKVERGEYLSTIARKYGSFVDSIKHINGLKSDVIHLNSRFKVDCSKYEILVDISNHTLTLNRIWEGSTNFVKRYSVGTGKTHNTPPGTFKIDLKQKEPTWYKSGNEPIPYGNKENLLGTRWMGIDCPGFGIHGTWAPESVGKSSSAGCIRMKNFEVEELYDIVPLGTTVKIQD